MEQKEQLFPEFKNEDIVGFIKFNGHRSEFLKFAQDIAIKVYDLKIPIDVEKHPQIDLYRKTTMMYIIGTVKGVVRNEIIFVKNKPKTDNGQSEDAKPVS